jgi:hypothetical protein
LRTKFWPALASEVTFAKIHVAESELQRLWKMIGVTMNGLTQWSGDEIVKVAETIGIDSYVYCRCKELSLSTDYVELLKTEPVALSSALGYEEAERLQIHERLDSKPFEMMATQIYAQFGIPSTEKMKKVALAKALCKWNLVRRTAILLFERAFMLNLCCVLGMEPQYAESSRSTMLILFPELDGSINIAFQQASSKSKRRFPSATKSPVFPLSKESWYDISLEGLIRKHSMEVTYLYIIKVPSIMAKLERCSKQGAVFDFGSTERFRVQKYLRQAATHHAPEPNGSFRKIERDSHTVEYCDNETPTKEATNGTLYPVKLPIDFS